MDRIHRRLVSQPCRQSSACRGRSASDHPPPCPCCDIWETSTHLMSGERMAVAREVRKVGVVGLGTMGAGIAEVLARSGVQVVGVENDDAGVERAKSHLATSTSRAVKRGKLTE